MFSSLKKQLFTSSTADASEHGGVPDEYTRLLKNNNKLFFFLERGGAKDYVLCIAHIMNCVSSNNTFYGSPCM